MISSCTSPVVVETGGDRISSDTIPSAVLVLGEVTYTFWGAVTVLRKAHVLTTVETMTSINRTSTVLFEISVIQSPLLLYLIYY
jgi:hypothetical protein